MFFQVYTLFVPKLLNVKSSLFYIIPLYNEHLLFLLLDNNIVNINYQSQFLKS
jgi:hypothetical protein